MGNLEKSKELFNKFSGRELQTKDNKKEHQAIKADNISQLDILKNIAKDTKEIIKGLHIVINNQGEINRNASNAFTAVCQLSSKIGKQQLNNSNNNFVDSISNFNKIGVPSQIQLTPKQLYLASKQGWSFEQLNGLSGYSKEEIVKKITQHMQSNV